MGMYVNLYFGVMITDDLGSFNTSDPDLVEYFEELGADHSVAGVESFNTVEDVAHIVGEWVGGISYGAHATIKTSELAHDEQYWIDAYNDALQSIPLHLRAAIMRLGLPKFHLIGGIN